jgi:hypothetical protein
MYNDTMSTNEVVNLDNFLERISQDIAPIIKTVGDVGILLSNHMRNLPIYKHKTVIIFMEKPKRLWMFMPTCYFMIL